MAESRGPALLRSPLIRLALIGIIVLVLFIVLTNVAISAMKSSRNQPISYDVYPGAQLVDQSKAERADTQIFETQDTLQQVLNFYAQKHGWVKTTEAEGNGCKKVYKDVEPSEEPGHTWGICVVSDSMLDVSQILRIRIDAVAAANGNSAKTTVVIQRSWGS